ncbi:hypothetical protein EJB05_18157 [Eragrostis curvula]|uniref:Uncharacterized protein n=1 Tax=Eragrostis curvula TaxID=38414 RepID=A0A5J9VIP7_9POAL|nr:hypothetical protein EJB05_18157 [Eragrostis curvula]
MQQSCQVTDLKKKKIHEVLKTKLVCMGDPKCPSLEGFIFCRIYMKSACVCCYFVAFNILPSSKHKIERVLLVPDFYHSDSPLSHRKDKFRRSSVRVKDELVEYMYCL